MKISNASKKVLASALSAAMVVAFAPTVAFGAQDGSKLTVNYSVGAGVSKSGGSQSTIASQEKLVVAKKADGLTAGTTGTIELQDGADLGLKSGDEYYSFAGWDVWADTNKDGKIVKEGTDADTQVTANVDGDYVVSDVNIDSSTPLYATAKYAAPAITAATATIDEASAEMTIAVTKGAETLKNASSAKYVVTAPDGTAVEKKVADLNTDVKFGLQIGTWTVALVDGNDVTVSTKEIHIGSVTLTGGVYEAFSSTSAAPRYVSTQTVWYDADVDFNGASTAANTYADILTHYAATQSVAHKVVNGAAATATSTFFAADGTTTAAEVKAGAKGAVASSFTAIFEGEETIAALTAKKGTVVAAAGIASFGAIDASDIKDPANASHTGYYMKVTDSEGKTVAESVNTDGDTTNDGTVSGVALTRNGLAAGTYTATLYKVTAKNSTLGDSTPGKMETVATKSIEMAGYETAAPTWSYAAAATPTASNAGTLTIANAAGEGFKVKYGTTSAMGDTYDTAKGGKTIGKQTSQLDYYIKATNEKAGEDLKESKTVTLYGYYTAKDAFDDLFTASNFAGMKVNGEITAYYATDAGVKAAIKAADEAYVAAGFAEKVKSDDNSVTAWKSVTTAGEQSVLDAVVSVAKAELAKYAEGVASKDGKTVTVLTAEQYANGVAAIEKAAADYKANHDGDTANNVAKANGVNYDGTWFKYVESADEALKTAVKGAKSIAKADADAAKAVNAAIAALPAEVTAANAAEAKAAAEAAIKAYGELNKDAKALVSSTDYDKAVQTIAAADAAVKDADEAAIAKVKGKTVKAKAAKKTTAKLKVVTSESGAKSTFKKSSGNSKVKVSKSGKITVKKGLKAGKKYTVKVKATVGASTKTVKVVVKVAK